MASVLATDTPPAPDNPEGNALTSQQPAAPMAVAAPAGAPAMPAPPTHEQTVAALRHFDAIKSALVPLLQDPELGKSNMKMKIIDAVTKLVSDRILSPGTAVDQLSQVPSEPLLQRKALQIMMQHAVQAERVILAHHAIGFSGQGPQPNPTVDSHADHMTALHVNYSKGRR